MDCDSKVVVHPGHQASSVYVGRFCAPPNNSRMSSWTALVQKGENNFHRRWEKLSKVCCWSKGSAIATSKNLDLNTGEVGKLRILCKAEWFGITPWKWKLWTPRICKAVAAKREVSLQNCQYPSYKFHKFFLTNGYWNFRHMSETRRDAVQKNDKHDTLTILARILSGSFLVLTHVVCRCGLRQPDSRMSLRTAASQRGLW